MQNALRPIVGEFAIWLSLVSPIVLYTAEAHAAAPAPCRVSGIRNEVLCGIVQRALDPAQPSGTQIDVHYVVVPAMARRKLPDPLFVLAGGPGQSAIAIAPTVLPLFARLNNRRDIVFVDQRGTGRSAPLVCEDMDDRLPLAELADRRRQVERLHACRDRLTKLPHGDLRHYTTLVAMADIDAVRQQLGVTQINLIGGSYGTRAALEMLRQFPHTLRRVVMDGVAPPDMVLPASFSTDSQASLDAMFDACEQSSVCTARHPSLRADWAALLKSLPREATLLHPLSGREERVMVTREMVLQAVRGPLYAPSLASALPQAIGEAAGGRFQPLAGLANALAARKSIAPAMGMHFSVICSEDMPRLAKTTDASGADFGSQFAQLYDDVCAAWPRGNVPDAFYTLSPSPVPVLLLSGGIDPVTPARHGQRVAQALGAKAVHVVVPNAGHGVMGIGCMRDVLFRFFETDEENDALAVDASCVKGIPRPPVFEPARLPAP
jgi:pimeloyl-ACP methyl ester carboxylesterase